MAIDIVELYKQAKEESIKRGTPGGDGKKAELIRQLVRQLADKTGEKELLAAAAYHAVKQALEAKGMQIQRSYFTQIVNRSFETVKKEGRVYILVK